MRSGWRYPGDDGHGRCNQLLDDPAGRLHETARSVQPNEEQGGTSRTRLINGSSNNFNRNRVNNAVDVKSEHLRRSRSERERQYKRDKSTYKAHPSSF